MNNIIKFKSKEVDTQTASGEAFCIGCGEEWIAIAETGTLQLECPVCKTMKGKFRFEFCVAEGELVRECNCKNRLFYLTPLGHMCANCGICQEYD
jgi:hypothetical protein